MPGIHGILIFSKYFWFFIIYITYGNTILPMFFSLLTYLYIPGPYPWDGEGFRLKKIRVRFPVRRKNEKTKEPIHTSSAISPQDGSIQPYPAARTKPLHV